MTSCCIISLLLTTLCVGCASPVVEPMCASDSQAGCDDNDRLMFVQVLRETHERAVLPQAAQRERSPARTVKIWLLMIMTNSFLLAVLLSVGLTARADAARTMGQLRAEMCGPALNKGMPVSERILAIVLLTVMYAVTDQYLASMPDMARDLGSSLAGMSATLQTNWFVKATSSLFIGYLSDRIGRRPCVLFCTLTLCVSTCVCACAPSMAWFMLGRVFQGIAEGGGTVYFAIIRDYYDDPKERLRAITFVSLFIALVPVLSPCLGELLASWMSWRYSFVVLFNITLLLLPAQYMFQAESAPMCIDGLARVPFEEQGEEQKEAKFAKLGLMDELSKIWDVVSNRHLATLILSASAGFWSIAMINDSVTALVLRMQFHKSVVHSSLLIGSFGIAILLGGVLTEVMAGLGPLRLCRICTVLVLIPVGFALIVAFLLPSGAWLYMSVLYVAGVWGMPFNSSSDTLILHPLKDLSGMVAGLKLSISTIIGSGVAVIGTRVAIAHGEFGVYCFTIALLGSSAIVFWLGFGTHTPNWAFEIDKGANDDK